MKRKSRAQYEPQVGDVLLFYNAGGFARLITWFTRSPYYHVGFYAGDGTVVEARVSGVVHRPLARRDRFHAVTCPGSEAALTWAKAQIGDEYDVVGVSVLVLERLSDRLRINYRASHARFSCSGLVLCAFRETGSDVLPHLQPEDVIPGDFAALLPEHNAK